MSRFRLIAYFLFSLIMGYISCLKHDRLMHNGLAFVFTLGLRAYFNHLGVPLFGHFHYVHKGHCALFDFQIWSQEICKLSAII